MALNPSKYFWGGLGEETTYDLAPAPLPHPQAGGWVSQNKMTALHPGSFLSIFSHIQNPSLSPSPLPVSLWPQTFIAVLNLNSGTLFLH